MGLRQKLIDAKVDALQESLQESIELDTSENSAIYLEADYTARAILETLSEANLTITKFRAPVVVESLKTPDQVVNIKLETLLGDKAPILKALRKLPIPAIGEIVDKLESEIEKAIRPLLQGGAALAGLDLGKDNGGLDCVGYVVIGEDPDSVENFDVEDEDGQRDNTTVNLSLEDLEGLM
jgi:hypothetical protein|tara:strand:+ start:174 stop:716 length:543 start_codon:yes stop_codon:yes gene_type:complete